MPELTLTPAELPAPALPFVRPDGHEPPPGSTPYYMTLTPDQVVQFRTLDLVEERALRGQMNAYRGEYVMVAPDGTVLAQTDFERDGERNLTALIERGEAKAVEVGIRPGELAMYLVPPLDD